MSSDTNLSAVLYNDSGSKVPVGMQLSMIAYVRVGQNFGSMTDVVVETVHWPTRNGAETD